MHRYPWVAIYDRDAFLAMLASQPPYPLMEPEQRPTLHEGICSLIDDPLGGWVTTNSMRLSSQPPKHANSTPACTRGAAPQRRSPTGGEIYWSLPKLPCVPTSVCHLS